MTELGLASGDQLSVPVVELPSFTGTHTNDNLMNGIRIYIQGFLAWHIWLHIAISEIRRRYRRTFLGPFWATLSVGIFIAAMGIVFPILWHMNAKTFLPFFASGYIIWSFVSTSIIESCGSFLDASGLIKQMSLPYPIYSNNVVARNFILLLHHLVVYVAIMLIFQVPVNLNTLLIVPAMIILCVTGSWVAILLGFISARFRDIKQVIVSFLQIALFVTPILWTPTQLGTSWQATLLVNINPLFHFVTIARAPLLGQQPSMTNWMVSIGVCVLGWLVTMKVLSKYYKHLVFWL